MRMWAILSLICVFWIEMLLKNEQKQDCLLHR
jgi:hypothetical protein